MYNIKQNAAEQHELGMTPHPVAYRALERVLPHAVMIRLILPMPLGVDLCGTMSIRPETRSGRNCLRNLVHRFDRHFLPPIHDPTQLAACRVDYATGQRRLGGHV